MTDYALTKDVVLGVNNDVTWRNAYCSDVCYWW